MGGGTHFYRETQAGGRAVTEYPKHWQGETARMLCCDPQIPGVCLEEAGSPKQGLPQSIWRNPIFTIACPAVELLLLLLTPTSPKGQAHYATLSQAWLSIHCDH